jgi:integrase
MIGRSAKSAASVRDIAIGAELADLLHQARDRARWSGHSLMFPEPTGAILSRNRIRNALRRCCAAAGVPIISPHGLRHAGASMAIRGGMDPEVAKERLGHHSAAFMYDHYVHPNQADHAKAADLVADLLSGTN